MPGFERPSVGVTVISGMGVRCSVARVSRQAKGFSEAARLATVSLRAWSSFRDKERYICVRCVLIKEGEEI